MKYLVPLFLIMFMLSACKKDDLSYEFERTGVEIIEAEIHQIPHGRMSFNAFYKGESPLIWDRAYLDTVVLETKDQQINLDNIQNDSWLQVEVDIFTNYYTSNTILYSEGYLRDYNLYLNYPEMLRKVTVLDTLTAERLETNKESDNFAENIFRYLTNLPDKDNQRLLILFIDYNKTKNDPYFERNFNRLSSLAKQYNNNWWFGIFYGGKFDRQLISKEIEIPDNCIFIEGLKVLGSGEQPKQVELIKQSISTIVDSRFIIDFTLKDQIDPRRTSYNIRLGSLVNSDQILEDRVTVNISANMIRNYYFEIIREWFQTAEGKIKSGNDYEQGLQWIDYAQTYWDMEIVDWYNPAKKRFLLDYSLFQKDNNYPYDDRILIYEEILRLDPGLINTKFDLIVCRGDRAFSLNRKEESLAFFQQALDLRADSGLQSILIRNLKNLLKEYYQSRNYSSLNRLSKLYSSYIINNFEYRYYWAEAAKHTYDTQEALRHFNWLLENWNTGITLVSWNDILNNLLGIHAEQMEFENAYNLLKRISINRLTDQMPDLIYAFSFLRGLYLKPVSLASIELFRSDSYRQASSLKNELTRTDLPQYLSSIYFMRNNNISDILWQNSRPELPVRNISGTGFVIGNNNNWFISGTNAGQFVIQANNYLNTTEDILYRELLDGSSIPGRWFNIEEHMYNNEKANMIKLLAGIIGTDYGSDGAVRLSSYRRAIETIPFIKYCIIQNDQQEIVYNQNYNTNLAVYLQDGWIRSSQAQLLFQQEINYGSERIVDVTYPLYYNGRYLGVIRIGFEKM